MIDNTEVHQTWIKVTLENGATVDISFNDGYIHFGFSKMENVVATPFAYSKDCPKMPLSNFLDVKYDLSCDL